MGSLLQDVRYAARMLRKSPAFTCVALLTLAIGIGANTALFSVVHGVLLNPLPFPQPEQLVTLYTRTTQFQNGSTSYLNFLDWQKQTRSFSSLAAYRGDDLNLIGTGDSERVHGQMVSAGFFETLGVRPLAGRTFLPEEDQVGAGPVVLISDGLWKRRFAGSPEILGKNLTLEGKSYAVIGVVPGHSPIFTPSDVFVPIGQWSDPTFRDRRISMGTTVVGRLKPGISLDSARADVDAVAKGLEVAFPEADRGHGIALVELKRDVVGNVQPFLLVLLGAVGFVLLIACANVANLLLARSTSRSREFAIRVAVGADRSRILRQLLTESVLLASAGGLLGLAIAVWGTKAVLATMPSALPRAEEVNLNGTALLFTLLVSVLAGILFGLAPALKISRPNLSETMREGGRGLSQARHRTQRFFVAGELALAVVLLIGAGLMIRTLMALWNVNPGFDARNLLTFSLTPSPEKTTTPDQIRSTYRQFLLHLESIPGVQGASILAGSLPMTGDSELPFWKEGAAKPSNDSDMSWALWYAVSPHYWKAMGIPLIRGRLFTDQDNEHSPTVVVVDEDFVQKYYPHEDPLGKRINLELIGSKAEIVGIVGHIRHWGLGSRENHPVDTQFYLPVMQIPDTIVPLMAKGMTVVARTQAAPMPMAGAIRDATRQIDGRGLVYDFEGMETIVSDSISTERFSMVLLAGFAAIALLLSAIGVYGVLSYLVGQRTHEVGIRMALGAQTGDILRMILRQGAGMVALGIGIGLLGAFILTRLMESMLFGVSKTDPSTFAGVSLVLGLIAFIAIAIPALRATRVNPTVALRYE